jgi:restriction system protein
LVLIGGGALISHPWLVYLAGGLAVAALGYLAWRFRKKLPRYKFDGRHWTHDDLMRLTPIEFERLVAAVYRELGYRTKENPYRGADGGVDLLLERQGAWVVVQCKRWHDVVTVKPVRELWGVTKAMGAQGAILVTTSLYTSAAWDWAAEVPNLELIDGPQFVATIERLSTAT